MRRLEELLGELANASNVMGNTDLEVSSLGRGKVKGTLRTTAVVLTCLDVVHPLSSLLGKVPRVHSKDQTRHRLRGESLPLMTARRLSDLL